MKFHPNGTLYASVISGAGGGAGAPSSLGIININTGVVSRVGPTHSGMDALAISSQTIQPTPNTGPVPAPTSWILVVTGLALVAFVQALLWRKNKTGMVS